MLGLVGVVVALAPWVLVVMYAWANTTHGSPGNWSTDWSRLASSLATTLTGAALVFAVCLAVGSVRSYLRGWRLIPASWLVALGGMCWLGATFVM